MRRHTYSCRLQYFGKPGIVVYAGIENVDAGVEELHAGSERAHAAVQGILRSLVHCGLVCPVVLLFGDYYLRPSSSTKQSRRVRLLVFGQAA